LAKKLRNNTFEHGCILMQETLWYVALPWECKVLHPNVFVETFWHHLKLFVGSMQELQIVFINIAYHKVQQ
jgi:hypothetical protein